MLINWHDITLILHKQGRIWICSQPFSNPVNDCLRIQPGKWKTRNHGAVSPELVTVLECAIQRYEGKDYCTTRKFAPTAGKAIGQPVPSGRPARRMTPREKRQNGRAE